MNRYPHARRALVWTSASAAPYTAVPSARMAITRNMSGEARGTISTTVMYAPTCGALNRIAGPRRP